MVGWEANMNVRGEKIDYKSPLLLAFILIGAWSWNLFGNWSAAAFAKQSNRGSQNNTSVRSDEPFHTRSVATPAGHILAKWGPVAAAIEQQLHTVLLCSATDKCLPEGAIKFRDILKVA